MSGFDLAIYTLKFLIPSVFAILFRAFGLGYKSRRSLILGLLVFALYLTVVPSVLIAVMGYGQYTHIVSLVMTIGGMCALIFSSDPPGKTIMLVLFVAQMNTVVSVILNMIRHIFQLSYLTLDIMLLMICPIIYVIALNFWAKPLRFIADNMHGKLTAAVMIPIVTTLMIYAIPVYPAQNYANHPVYCTILMLAIELMFFLYLFTLYRSLLQISVLSKQELKAELLHSEIDAYQSFVQTAKQSRHDLRYHDALLLEYLETGDTGGARDYLRAHYEVLKSSEMKSFCNNPTVNAILRMYERQSYAVGIVFFAMADIPETLPLTAPELAALLSNLLENALEACTKSDEQDRYMTFSTELQENKLLMELRNTAPRSTIIRNGMPLSQRLGGGTGTRSVVATVRKYGGMVEFSQEDKVFFARVILPLQN